MAEDKDNSFAAIKARDDAYIRANGRYSYTNAARAAHDRGILVQRVLDLEALLRKHRSAQGERDE